MKLKILSYVFHSIDKNKDVVYNLFWKMLQMTGKHATTFIIFILAAKLLSTYDFGVYNYLMSFVLLLIIFCDFGVSTAISKYTTEILLKNKFKINSLFFNGLIIMFIFSSIISFMLLIIGNNYYKTYFEHLIWLVLLVYLLPISNLIDGFYRGHRDFKKLSIISLISGFITIPTSYFLIKNLGINGALISQSIYLILFISGGIIDYKPLSIKINTGLMKELLKYSLAIGLANLGIYLYTRADVLILGHYGYISEISYYEIANRIFTLLALPFSLISLVIAPKITKMFVQKKKDLIKNSLKNIMIGSFIIGVIISLASIYIVPKLINLYLPNYDLSLFKLFFILLMTIFPIRLVGIFVASYSVSTGHVKILTINNIFFGVINVLMDLLFIKLWGFIGVVVSTLILGYISILVVYKHYMRGLK